jgi:2-oxoglutarate ferredoxin oxidoreductase subunit gamma
VISEQPIGSPVVGFPNVLIAMNGPVLDSFEDTVAPGCMIIVNSSLVTRKVKRKQYIDVNLKAVEAAVQFCEGRQ